jgi:two-component system response regulator (stage 0 sporulation protein F)
MARILVVDDDSNIRGLLDTVLSRKGHRVFTAGHGQKGLDVFRRERPDLTILDIELPDMNGIEVLRQIKTVDQSAPVIILTGTGAESLEKRARDLGATEFLAKGFSLHELGDALQRILEPPAKGLSASGRARGTRKPT